MKPTRLKISVSQDGLIPEETADVATLELPALPKKLLKALGFERVDSNTYVGVLPVFINIGDKEQEIEIELGVTLPEMRKKVLEIVKIPSKSSSKPKADVIELPKTGSKAKAEKNNSKKEKTQKTSATKVKQHARRKN